AKAQGFAERSGIILTAALTREDLHALSAIRRLSQVEIDTVASWATPPGWDTEPAGGDRPDGGRPLPAPGVGKVLIKVGQRPGIPTQVVLTPTELALHDSNHRWAATPAAAALIPAQHTTAQHPPAQHSTGAREVTR
ncbi:MAG: hypothetical protein JO144_01320, partial [Actinobacteria bacterium]|nr:hypothetical protein [Actinomycetota bacterium]